MKKFWIFIFLLHAQLIFSQCVSPPVTTLYRLLPITEIRGIAAVMLNPAGLSAQPQDDGVLVNYNFYHWDENQEFNFGISLSSLAFGVQNFPLPDDLTFKTYRVGLAVGGRVFSVGTTQKLLELKYPHHATRRFSSDIGFLFRPFSRLLVAGVVKDVNEPVFDNYRLGREYSLATRLRILGNLFNVFGQIAWCENTIHLKDADYRAGVSFGFGSGFEISLAGYQNANQREEFGATLLLPLVAGIKLFSGILLDDQGEIQRYSATMLIPLKTVTF